jgi:Peptidase family M23/Bacterial SH3 domain
MSATTRLGPLFAPLLLSLTVACGGGDGLERAGDGTVPIDPGTAASGGAAGTAGAGGEAGSAEAGAGGAAGAAGAAGSSTLPDSCPRVEVTVPAGEVLNVRPSPSTKDAAVGTLDSGAIVDVLALVHGEELDQNDLWYEIKAQTLTGYVWSGLVACTSAEPPVAPPGYYLPLVCGKTATVTQGNFGSYSHQGLSAYAFDFSLGIGTPMVAMADGTVSKIYDQTLPGDPCYSGGGPTCATKANLVVLLHGDGTETLYAHLSKVLVKKGQQVTRGTKVGLSGSTGYSTGPHAHVARQQKCTSSTCQSIALKFVDFKNGGVPKTGDTVKSGNCP